MLVRQLEILCWVLLLILRKVVGCVSQALCKVLLLLRHVLIIECDFFRVNFLVNFYFVLGV